MDDVSQADEAGNLVQADEQGKEDDFEVPCEEEEEELNVNVQLDATSFSTMTMQSASRDDGKGTEVDVAVLSMQSKGANFLQNSKISEVPSAAERFSQLMQSSQLLNPALFKQIPDFDPEIFPEKPWAQPGENLSDYFNYGFTPETYQAYIQRKKSILEFNNGSDEKMAGKRNENSNKKRRDREADRRYHQFESDHKNARERSDQADHRVEKTKNDQNNFEQSDKDLARNSKFDYYGEPAAWPARGQTNSNNFKFEEQKNWEISKDSPTTANSNNRSKQPAAEDRDARFNKDQSNFNSNRKDNKLNSNRYDNQRGGDYRHDASSNKDHVDRGLEKNEYPNSRQKDRRYDSKPEFTRNKRSRDRSYFDSNSDRKRRK